MPSDSLTIDLLPEPFGIYQLAAGAPVPAWATSESFSTVSRTPTELSIICASAGVPAGVRGGGGWRALRLEGPFDFALVGVLLRVATPLAAAGVSIMPVATYDTDYVLVREEQLAAALRALRDAGHRVRDGVAS